YSAATRKIKPPSFAKWRLDAAYPAVMVEKDFWVSWTLAVLFAHPEFGEQLVFKGGTSLSKVFGMIERFSEDIDLSVSPEFVGINEEWGEEAESRNKRT